MDPDTPKVIELTERIVVRQEVDNIGWADMGDYLLVVDALEKPNLESEVFGLFEETFPGKSVRYVLNTHTHYDHVALNRAMQSRYGAEIVNMNTCSVPADGRWFEGENCRALMLPMRDCHTREDCVVWFPDEAVLFVGDIFGWGLIPIARALTPDARDLLLSTYRRLIDFEAEHIVPGHGPLCTNLELQRWTEYFEWVIDEVKAAFARGITENGVDEELIPPPEDMHGWWRFCEWKHADTLRKAARAVARNRI